MKIFKFWILLRCILKNFSYTLKFINRFKKLIKKFDLVLNAKEEEFIYFVQEVNFTLWRPIKIVPVNFNLEKKENFFFKNHDVNIHTINKDNKITFLNRGTLLLTNQRLIIEDEISKNHLFFYLNKIEKIENLEYGIKIKIDKKYYLLREQNNVLILALLHRILGKDRLKFDLYAIPDSIKPIKYNKRYNL